MSHARHLPPDRAAWHVLFLAAISSSDPAAGMSSAWVAGSLLSKVSILAPSMLPDVDNTFVHAVICDSRVDCRGCCGNTLAAVGRSAVDLGLVRAAGYSATVRIHNTNIG